MPDAKFTLTVTTGRLIEARVFALWTAADAEAYAAELQRLARPFTAGVRPVLLADHRPVKVYPTAVSDRLYELFSTMNLVLERAALVIVPNNVPLTLQLQRLVDDADNSKRRLFTDPVAAAAHVSSMLDYTERTRATAFLAEY